MTLIEKIDKKAEQICDRLAKDNPDVWYCLDGYSAFVWLTPWNKSGSEDSKPAYKITSRLECVALVMYPFESYRKEHLSALERGGKYTNNQLTEMFWQEYANHCHNNNMLSESRPYCRHRQNGI